MLAVRPTRRVAQMTPGSARRLCGLQSRPMQTLRRYRWLARLLLAWWALSVGVAAASPLVHPQALQWVCSGAGAIKLLVTADEGAGALARHTLDCPLCTHAGAPPPVVRSAAARVRPLAQVLQPVPTVPIAVRAAAPLPPPRGPPGRA